MREDLRDDGSIHGKPLIVNYPETSNQIVTGFGIAVFLLVIVLLATSI